ncbi:10131_t:CDS:2 [Dentiscutata heterogama]|uniref:10131_t:CDS:1 n=1 Tax=Dentiscutata heterogama TaxID=1316150 RepID=A0ACA9L4J0_9GLOM|nr:10131_t:CDS:2 [Dentiscutata heterogama]
MAGFELFLLNILGRRSNTSLRGTRIANRIIMAESVKVDWIGVPVPKDITVRQFYEDLIAGKFVSEVWLDNEDHLQPIKAEFSSNKTGPFNVVSMEFNMTEALEAWGNRVQYYQTNSSTSLLE